MPRLSTKKSGLDLGVAQGAAAAADPYRSLWSVVMIQGFAALKMHHKRAAKRSTLDKKEEAERRLAVDRWRRERDWVFEDDSSFIPICHMIDLDPEAVREQVREWPESREHVGVSAFVENVALVVEAESETVAGRDAEREAAVPAHGKAESATSATAPWAGRPRQAIRSRF